MKDAGVGFGQRWNGRFGVRHGIGQDGAIRCVEGNPRWLRERAHTVVDVRATAWVARIYKSTSEESLQAKKSTGEEVYKRSLLAAPELCVEKAAEEGAARDASHACAVKGGLWVGQLTDA